jgi:23S rRNA pseudouridine955/2504/2580 synthase
MKTNSYIIEIDDTSSGQRIDNFLLRVLKDIPKSHVYKIIRSGEVRVNKKRIKSLYKLQENDQVRIPPVTQKERKEKSPDNRLELSIIHEDEWFMVINKPSGLAVHGGSGIDFGLIEYLRNQRKDLRYLELVHRLDKNTSGLILIAKKRSSLRSLQELFRNKQISKFYLVAVQGLWKDKVKDVSSYLKKVNKDDGHHVHEVKGPEEGKLSRSIFYLESNNENYSILSVHLITGRTHQIRVQLANLGFPILGDDKYGNFDLNRKLVSSGLKKMFLHSHKLRFHHPFTDNIFECISPLPNNFEKLLNE